MTTSYISYIVSYITHWGMLTNICVSELGVKQIHYPNQDWLINKLTLMNELGWIFTTKFIWKCRLQYGDHFVQLSIC